MVYFSLGDDIALRLCNVKNFNFCEIKKDGDLKNDDILDLIEIMKGDLRYLGNNRKRVAVTAVVSMKDDDFGFTYTLGYVNLMVDCYDIHLALLKAYFDSVKSASEDVYYSGLYEFSAEARRYLEHLSDKVVNKELSLELACKKLKKLVKRDMEKMLSRA